MAAQIDRDKGFVYSRAGFVYRSGEQLLTRATVTLDENANFTLCDTMGLFQQLFHARALADYFAAPT